MSSVLFLSLSYSSKVRPIHSGSGDGTDIHLYLTDFKARNTGHVINIGSLAGRESYSGGSVYCATKAAVRAFTGSLLREVVNTPIRVTEIQPGPVLLPPLLPLLTLHYAP